MICLEMVTIAYISEHIIVYVRLFNLSFSGIKNHYKKSNFSRRFIKPSWYVFNRVIVHLHRKILLRLIQMSQFFTTQVYK